MKTLLLILTFALLMAGCEKEIPLSPKAQQQKSDLTNLDQSNYDILEIWIPMGRFIKSEDWYYKCYDTYVTFYFQDSYLIVSSVDIYFEDIDDVVVTKQGVQPKVLKILWIS